ncbi:MAG: aldehyde dehydrogenase family protein [Elusimicrobiota bacterium]
MATAAKTDKITYTSANVDMTEFHLQFDKALAKLRAEAGRSYPLYIGGRAVETKNEPVVDVSPIDTSLVLGRFASAGHDEVDAAIRNAYGVRKEWEHTPWPERVKIMRQAAALVRERKYELAALMGLEVGKNRMECIGDAEESADLIDYYAQQMEDHKGYIQELNKITPIETNTDILRPFGVFVCVAPFNFPLALSCGMSSACLVAGNVIVYKPSKDTPWTGLKLYEIYRDAGVPAGAFNFITGRGADMGDSLWRHPLVGGIVFTGSKQVGMHMYREFSSRWVKPCMLELGGKNATVVMDSADLDAAAEGIMKSAWGLQNQKCSACSRVYAHKSVVQELTAKIIERTRAIKMGDPTEKDVYFGPVINGSSIKKYEQAVAQAKKDGEILIGGERLKGGVFDKGNFLAPTIARLPLSSSLFMEELFVPFLAIGEVETLDQALEECNKAEYGLTSGIFSKNKEEVEHFFDMIETGVTYANKRTGATTGAWPGAQAFCGWKGSGSTGKGGCGPYYVAQFMREQCRTVIEEV